MNNAVKKIRLFLFSVLLITTLFLIYKAVVPFGKITYTVNMCDKSFFISTLKPEDRMGEIDKTECTRRILGDPVYFNVNTQRGFDEAEVKIKYRKSAPAGALGALNIIELGLLADKQKNYKLKPVENKIIDNLEWDKIIENGITLLQREKQHESVDEFLNSTPPRDEILTYKYDLPLINKIENYIKSNEIAIINKPLRGPYQIYTYIDDEALEWEFEFYDLNINDEVDGITVNVYHDKELIYTEKLDNLPNDDVKLQQLRLENLPAGVYKIAVVASTEIITKSIATKQKYISFINKVWLAEAGNLDLIELYTDSMQVNARTNNAASLQKILVGEEVLNVNESYKQFSKTTDQKITKIQFAKDDLLFIGDGVFSFSQAQLFNPSYKKITSNSSLENINYIITEYTPPIEEGDWKIQTIKYDLRGVIREDNNYGFIITIPGLLADDEVEDYVEIGEIEVKLRGTTLLEKLF